MKSILYTFIIALFVFSCKGDDGPVGPRGPQGPQGPAGTGGGSSAKTVQFLIEPLDWNEFGTQNTQGYGYGVQLDVPDITQSVYDYGAVITFMRFEGNPVWESIPASFSLSGLDQFWNVFHELSTVYVEIYDNDFNTVRPTDNIYLKIVVIDGEQGAKYTKPDIDFSNYDAVKNYYHLE